MILNNKYFKLEKTWTKKIEIWNNSLISIQNKTTAINRADISTCVSVMGIPVLTGGLYSPDEHPEGLEQASVHCWPAGQSEQAATPSDEIFPSGQATGEAAWFVQSYPAGQILQAIVWQNNKIISYFPINSIISNNTCQKQIQRMLCLFF